ncbi:hypothetical protein G7046_g9542 [Stylonectria norvegica]|nr:hypothetical protein G7046_g9542 [Stylonectria norvegica]
MGGSVAARSDVGDDGDDEDDKQKSTRGGKGGKAAKPKKKVRNSRQTPPEDSLFSWSNDADSATIGDEALDASGKRNPHVHEDEWDPGFDISTGLVVWNFKINRSKPE